MTKKFKIGDKVRVTATRYGSSQYGDVGYIEEVRPANSGLMDYHVRFTGKGAIKKQSLTSNSYYEDELELVNDEDQLKVGDRVTFSIDPTHGIGTVRKLTAGYNDRLVAVEFEALTHGHDFFDDADITPANPKSGRYCEEQYLTKVEEEPKEPEVSANPFITEETTVTRKLSDDLNFVSSDGAQVNIRKSHVFVELDVPGSSALWDANDLQELIDHLTNLQAALVELDIAA